MAAVKIQLVGGRIVVAVEAVKQISVQKKIIRIQ